MDTERQQGFRDRLLKEKQELLERIEGLNQGLHDPMRESIGELSMYDNHPADIGDELFERGKDLSLRDNAEIQLNHVERALHKIEDHSYGLCDQCGRPIPQERLEAMPSANLCMACKKAEEVADRTPRPIEEEVIRPPFGEQRDYSYDRKFGDQDNQPVFDGEDAWQAVARFGTADSPQDLAESGAQYPNVYDDWDEDVGAVDDVDNVAYYRSKDGMAYKDFRSGYKGRRDEAGD
ncbi:TraR/DksA C4-type zinc finger protein [Candidatus Formimonas warabiya]|uniref:TraR/DksA C4-type zinc finger protein n=1 Tax=Formimonas warabiya TaxID=1761012 RepID=UPI0011D052DC|nr:TraR/DksA C4-type zinc finger protein [Candidatus Formimonas warabiya]